jgi:hypothetical protein
MRRAARSTKIVRGPALGSKLRPEWLEAHRALVDSAVNRCRRVSMEGLEATLHTRLTRVTTIELIRE